jgi:hypothetical protein
MLNVKKLILFCMLLSPMLMRSQTCDSLVPFFVVDLSSDPDSVWISPSIQRAGYCCGAVYPETCLEFEVTISPSAIGIIFNIINSQPPMGAIYTKTNCTNPVAVGSPIFLSSPGPHQITFCKPGNNVYQYSIESIPGTAGVSNYDETYPVNIYPNPANYFIIIESKSNSNQTYNLIDISGRVILSDTFRERKEIKLGSITPGFYVIEVLSACHSTKKKIIIE